MTMERVLQVPAITSQWQDASLEVQRRSSLRARCFPLAGTVSVPVPENWFEQWRGQYTPGDWLLADAEMEALGELLPLLLCGEQSAQCLFAREAESLRRRDREVLADTLQRIESEEAVHEHALQYLTEAAPVPGDIRQRRRRAQQFYLELARGVSLGEHFARIEALDSCVSRIMHALAQAFRGSGLPLAELFTAIKLDEARHVGVCRRYAIELGVSAADRAVQRRQIGGRVVALLEPYAAAFDGLGVDPEPLFARIQVGVVV